MRIGRTPDARRAARRAKAGAAYIPLDPEYPVDRLAVHARRLGRARPHLDRSAGVGLPTVPPHVLRVDADADVLAMQSVEPLNVVPALEDAAYAIYTSGFTGRPKGALIAHRGIASFTATQARTFAMGPGRRVLQFASFSFDALGVGDCRCPLHRRCACRGPARRAPPGPDLARFAKRHRVDSAMLPPSALTVMAPSDFPTVTTLLLAGEACPDELAAAWVTRAAPLQPVRADRGHRLRDAPRVVGDGAALGARKAHRQRARTDSLRVGRPCPHRRLGRDLPRGDGVGRGYMNRAELTRSASWPTRCLRLRLAHVPHRRPWSVPGERRSSSTKAEWTTR